MTNETKQTAVEWLKQQLETYGNTEYCVLKWKDLDALLEQAKEMEKAQIKIAYFSGWESLTPPNDLELSEAEDYYNKTYGGNK